MSLKSLILKSKTLETKKVSLCIGLKENEILADGTKLKRLSSSDTVPVAARNFP